jgi:hypothetical protein
MAGRIKHRERSRKTRDRSGMFRKYVIGNMPLYGSDYGIIHRLTNLFKHQSR